MFSITLPRHPDRFHKHAVRENGVQNAQIKVSGGLEEFRTNKPSHYAKQGTFFFLHRQQAL